MPSFITAPLSPRSPWINWVPEAFSSSAAGALGALTAKSRWLAPSARFSKSCWEKCREKIQFFGTSHQVRGSGWFFEISRGIFVCFFSDFSMGLWFSNGDFRWYFWDCVFHIHIYIYIHNYIYIYIHIYIYIYVYIYIYQISRAGDFLIVSEDFLMGFVMLRSVRMWYSKLMGLVGLLMGCSFGCIQFSKG